MKSDGLYISRGMTSYLSKRSAPPTPFVVAPLKETYGYGTVLCWLSNAVIYQLLSLEHWRRFQSPEEARQAERWFEGEREWRLWSIPKRTLRRPIVAKYTFDYPSRILIRGERQQIGLWLCEVNLGLIALALTGGSATKHIAHQRNEIHHQLC